MLESITFTGVDLDTPIGELLSISQQYPKAEFGVLVGTRTGSSSTPYDNPRFPPFEVVHQVSMLLDRVAIHLCGDFARDAVARQLRALAIANGFGRIQVNRSMWNLEDVKHCANFADNAGCPVIVQVRDLGGAEVVDRNSGLLCLFDLSGGNGLNTIDKWPTPWSQDEPCGYAGGINPRNFNQAMDFVEQHPDARIWLDMENGVRTEDRFDLDKVSSICHMAWGGGPA